MRRTLVLFLTLLLLWTIVTQLNHALTPLHVYVFTGSLFAVYAALTQPLVPGMIATALGGLLCDAHMPIARDLSPLAFSLAHTHLLLFAAAHATIFHLRDRVPRDDTTTRVIVAVLANFVLFMLFSFIEIALLPTPAAVWPRLIVDLICSQVFVALVTPWFFAVQARALALVRLERDEFA
jgi:rod shape-determining protein MreD